MIHGLPGVRPNYSIAIQPGSLHDADNQPLRLPPLTNNGYSVTYYHNTPYQNAPVYTPPVPPSFPSLSNVTTPFPSLQPSLFSLPQLQAAPTVVHHVIPSMPADQFIPQVSAAPHLPVVDQLENYHRDKRLAEQSRGFRSTSIKTNSAWIGLNTALFITEAALVGTTFGGLAPALAPMMVLHAGLIGKSVTDIARKKRARKQGV